MFIYCKYKVFSTIPSIQHIPLLHMLLTFAASTELRSSSLKLLSHEQFQLYQDVHKMKV